MPTVNPVQLNAIRQRIEASDADLSGSTFHDVNLAGAQFDDINLSGAAIHDANLSHVSITESCIAGMTIEGVLVSEMQAAYRASLK